MVAGLTIFDYGRFRSNVSLQNLSDDVALSVRRAQNYAIGVHSSESAIFSVGYGIHFTTAAPVAMNARSGSSKTFMIFSDLNKNNQYDYPISSSVACNSSTLSAGDECLDMLNIATTDTISAICPNGANCADGTADITFIRPNPEPTICINGSCAGYTSVDIKIRNTESGETKIISVSNVGQISIK